MKIFYIHTTKLESKTPSNTFMLNRALGISKNNIDIDIIIMKDSDPSTQRILKENYDLESMPYNINFKRFYTNNHTLFYLKTIKYLIKSVKNDDIIYTRALTALPYLYIFSKAKNNKIFYETHDFFINLDIRNDINKSKKKKKSILERIFLNRLNGLICVSNTQKKLYEDYIKIPIIALPCGIDNYFYEPKEKGKLIVYVGSFDKHKGLENILNLSEKLNFDYKVYLIGAKNEKEISETNELINKYDIKCNLKIFKWMQKEQLKEILKKAKIGLVPLRNTFFNTKLTSPLKIYDYYKYEIPVIASDFETTSEMVKDGQTGYLVKWNNLDDIINKISNVGNNYEHYRDEIIKFNKRLDNINLSRQLIQFFEEN